MSNDHAAHAQAAFASFTISAGTATVAWLSSVEQILRIASSAVALASGIGALVYYGKQNGWWK
jgi:uncharacterized membrane protein